MQYILEDSTKNGDVHYEREEDMERVACSREYEKKQLEAINHQKNLTDSMM